MILKLEGLIGSLNMDQCQLEKQLILGEEQDRNQQWVQVGTRFGRCIIYMKIFAFILLIGLTYSQCHYSCGVCLGANDPDQCTACNSGRTLLANPGKCQCNAGTYDDLSNQYCPACSVTCATCSAQTVCLTCPANSYRTFGTGACPCDTGYIDNGTAICSYCHYSCEKCAVNLDSSKCITCPTGRTLAANPGICECDGATYDNGVDKACAACSVTCATCTTQNQCKTCPASSHRTFNNVDKTCPCDSKYYGTAAVCLDCHYSCATCTAGNAQTDCVSCNSAPTTKYRVLTVDKKCACINGHYNINNQQLCGNCQHSCMTCTAVTSCVTCDTTLFRKSIVNIFCDCVDGYYDDGSNQACAQCDHSCKTCSIASTNCTTCDSTREQTLVLNKCPCIVGSYDDGVNQACVKCPQGCYTCTNGSECATCSQSIQFRIYNTSTKLCSCIAKYVTDGVLDVCAQCDTSCLYCSAKASTSDCTSCNGTAFRKADFAAGASGTCSCMDGYFPTASVEQCDPCSVKCLTCSAFSTCTSCSAINFRKAVAPCDCQDGYYQINTAVCAKCSYKCATCTGSAVCATCPLSSNRDNQPATNCPCSAKFYDSGVQLCVACDTSCATCTNATSCSSCTASRTLSNSQCICAIRKFVDAVDTCGNCHQTCLTCSGTLATNCLSCNFAAGRQLSSGSCICMAGYYQSSPTVELCGNCDYSCQTCSAAGASNCQSCNTTYFRIAIAATGTCLCKDGYYDKNLVSACQACHYSCKTCLPATPLQCDTCDNSLTINRVTTVNATTNLCDCAVLFYDDGANQACKSCHYSCTLCSNSTSSGCTDCGIVATNHRTLVSGACACQPTFYDTGAIVCTGCTSVTCYTCNSVGCTSCNSLNNRYLSGVLCSCLSGFYEATPVVAACSACDSTCLTCSVAATTCLTCNEAVHFRSLVAGVCKCKDGYRDAGTAICVKCPYSCLTCDATNCLSCDGSKGRVLTAGACPCTGVKTYDNGADAQCVTCNYKCATCDATGCLTCHTSRTKDGNTCTCKDKSYDDGSSEICSTCHYSCKTCTNSTACTTCDVSTNFRTLNGSTKYCSCLPKKYDDLALELCQPCDTTCLTCSTTGDDKCLTCEPLNFRSLNSATKCECLIGYYQASTIVESCLKCSDKCLTCAVSSSACTSCNGSNWRQTTPACNCKAEYYFDNGAALCASCHYSCVKCPNAGECSSDGCDTAVPSTQRAFDAPSKQCLCGIGFYDNGVTLVCSSCKTNCYTCVNGYNCTSCNTAVTNRELLNGDCVCKEKFFGATCTACDRSCKTCSALATTCTSCNPLAFRVIDSATSTCPCMGGYIDDPVLTNQACLKCDYSCLTCNPAVLDSCASCLPSSHRVLDTTGAKGLCNCPVQYYSDNINTLCQKCHYSCKTCTTGSACATCDDTKNRDLTVDPISGKCKCSNTFYDNGFGETCESCPYQCASCTNSTACFNCSSVNHRVPNGNTCSCDLGYYNDGVLPLCARCDLSCLTCSSSGSCLTCNTSDDRELTVTCKCKTGFYDTLPATSKCSQCLPECATCADGTSCLTCPAGSNRQIATGRCVCPNGFFDNGGIVCGTCHYSCQTCTNALSCVTCRAVDNREMISTPFCVCKATFWNNASNAVCLSCHASCQTCSNSSSTACLTCPPSSFRTLIAGSCGCNQYYFDDSTAICKDCNYACATCSNTVNCTACDSATNHRYLSTATNECLCSTGFYNVATQRTCSSCLPSCVTCSLGTQCLTCNTANHRDLGANKLCDCVAGFYNNNNNPLCATCQYTCKTCSSTTSCLTCDEGNNRNAILAPSGFCVCKNGFYDDGTAVCKACLYPCFTCTGPLSCLTCSALNHRTLVTLTNTCPCDAGFFDSNTNNQLCSTCDYTCATCEGSTTNCTTCLSTNQRSLLAGPANTHSCPCLQYYYNKPLVPLCDNCHFSCSSCTTNTQCSSCNLAKFRTLDTNGLFCDCLAGYFSNGVETCQKCLYDCQTCSTSTTCLTCNSAVSKRTTKDANDRCPCDIKYYDNLDYICSQCLYHCKQCTNGTGCSSCELTDNREMDLSTKQCVCKQYFFDDGLSNSLCANCHYSCNTCTNLSQCATCSNTDHRFLNTTTKLCQCSPTFFNDGVIRVCTACDFSCATCSEISKCLTCNPANFRQFDASNLLCVCKQGYFSDGTDPICKPCHVSCWTCVNAFACTGCNTTYNRVPAIVSNACPCLDQFYDDTINMNCPSCYYTCKTCNNGTGCLTCDATKQRSSSGSSCVCAAGYYDDGTHEVCPQCNYKCVTCSKTSTNCTACNLNDNKRNTIPSCNCIDKYYNSGTNPICQSCHFTCAKCVAGNLDNQCTSCNSAKQRTYSAGKCTCLPGYFSDGVNEDCVKCHYSCQTCTALTTCVTCNLNNQRDLSVSSCPCNQRFFDNGVSLCASCHYSCNTCSTSNTQCNDCNSTRFRQKNLTSNLCDCSNGYFDVGTSLELCSQCDASCLSCTNGTACKACINSNNRTLNATTDMFGVTSQFCVCVYGFYSAADNVTCSPCHYSCQLCSGPASTQCKYCSNEYKRALTSGVCKCVDGYYDGGDAKCQKCQDFCTKCTAPGYENCQACAPTYYFTASLTSCTVSCGTHTWIDEPNKTCQPCSANCKVCTNSTYCTTCDPTYYFLISPTSTTCLLNCPGTHYKENTNTTCTLCSLQMSECASCSSSTVCTSCTSGFVLNSPPNKCIQCSPNCKTCVNVYTECTDCTYPAVLQASKTCLNITCAANQYPNSLLGCRDCTTDYPNSATCNNLEPLTCLDSFFLNQKTCSSCTGLGGFVITNGICTETCGDGNNYKMGCDDGNLLDGDGCSSTCTVESGWECSNSLPTVNSNCSLLNPLSINSKSMRKIPGSNRLIVTVTTSLPVRLTTTNTLITLTNDGLQSYTINMISLQEYEFDIYYKATVQLGKMSISLDLTRGRRLLLSSHRLLGSTNFNIDIDLNTYPPAIYYSNDINNIYNGLKIFLHIVCALTLVLAVVGFIGVKKTVFYSMELFNLMVILYVMEGMGLAGASDWIAYTIPVMKNYILLGGFSIGICQCYANVYQIQYGYCDQLFENSGIVMAADVLILAIVAVLFGLYKSKHSNNPEEKKPIDTIDKFWIFGKYYGLAFCLVFNANVIFSSFLMFMNSGSSTTSIINLIFAILAVAMSAAFFVGLFIWTRQLSIPIIFPLPKPIQKEPDGGHDRSSAILSGTHSRNGGSEEHEEREKQKEFDPERDDDSYFDGESDDQSRKSVQNVFSNQLGIKNGGVEVSAIQLQRRDDQRQPTQQEQVIDEYQHPKYYRMLICDFSDNFNEDSWARFYIFIYAALVFFTMLFVAFLRPYHIPKFAILVALHAAFLVYVIICKPFKSKFNNFRSICVQMILIALLGCNLAIVINPTYTYGLELGILVALCLILLGNIGMYVVQVVFAYYQQLSEYFGWAKPEKNVPMEESPKIEEDHDQKMEKVEMDAFFERVLKKNKINKQYRRERRLKARD